MNKNQYDEMIKNMEAVDAAVDLGQRAGASGFSLGWDCPHVPDLTDDNLNDHWCEQVTWWASINYRDSQLETPPCPSLGIAAVMLALTMLDGAVCRCGRDVALPCDNCHGTGLEPNPRSVQLCLDCQGTGKDKDVGADTCLWLLRDGKWDSTCEAPSVEMPAEAQGDLEKIREAGQMLREARG